MKADTLVPNPASVEAFNRYTYAYNSPLKFKDPSGHKPIGNEWFEIAWNKIKSSLGWGESGSSYTSYGYSRGDFFYEMATEKINPQGFAQGVAGVAASTREFEFQAGAAYLGGLADTAHYASSLAVYDYMRGAPAPSQELMDIVLLDLANEPGYWVSYGAGVATGVATVVVPTGGALLFRLRSLNPVRIPRVRARASPGNRTAPELGQPGYPPVVAGASPGPLDSLFDFPRGVKVAVTPYSVASRRFLRCRIARPTGETRNDVPLIREETVTFRFASDGEVTATYEGPDPGQPVVAINDWLDNVKKVRGLESTGPISMRFYEPDLYHTDGRGGLVPDGPVKTDLELFLRVDEFEN